MATIKYIVVDESLGALELLEEMRDKKMVSVYEDEDICVIAAKGVNKSALKKIAKSIVEEDAEEVYADIDEDEPDIGQEE